jgi:hypothetical protein
MSKKHIDSIFRVKKICKGANKEWRRRGMHMRYWWESQKERDHWDNIKMDLKR